RRFICGRGWTRQLLAGSLGVDPARLVFVRDGRGKPRLGRPDVPWLRFNVSHSAGVAVFAIARNREVGVDIEEMRPDFPIDAVARRFFSAREQRALAASAANDRIDAFFALWCQKEAYLKGIGIGLGEVNRDPALAARRDHWSISSFHAAAGFAAAVAVEGTQVQVPADVRLLTLPRPD